MTGWPETRLTDLLGTKHPIIQAPMAGASTPEMAAAAANAGALGSLGVALDAPQRIAEEIRGAKALTNGALNLNFFCHQPPEMDPVKIEGAKAALTPFYAEYDLGTPDDPIATPPFDEDRLDIVLAASPRVVSFH
ncbi:MAG: nitronate monooxygenase, partial [Pseudomonadota bacterium]